MNFFRFSKQAVAWLFAAMMLLILTDVLIVQNFVEQFTKRDFSLSNPILFLSGLCAIALIALVGILCNRYLKKYTERWINRKSIALCCVLLFVIQTYIAYNIYFFTDWDCAIVTQNAANIANGLPIDSNYYSLYPNNLFITYFYALILSFNHDLFSLVLVQCFFSAIVAYLVYSVVFELVKNKLTALFAFLFYCGYIGMSPWFSIPYSDATGILFPIAILRLWQLANANESVIKKGLLYASIGILSFLGYHIKPQIIIVVIAIIIFQLIKLFFVNLKQRKWRENIIKLGALSLAFLLSAAAYHVFLSSQKDLVLDPEREYGVSHFFMMGLNEERHGVWYEEDVAYSGSFATAEERTKGNFEKAFQRIKDYGFDGMVEHLAKKTLVNYGDGSFAWGVEGTFFVKIPDEPNHTVAQWLRSFVYAPWVENGAYAQPSHYDDFLTVSQFSWLITLTLAMASFLFVLKRKKECESDEMAVILLSLIGLTLFETLFEPRSRYLFTYAPFFIICASIGLFFILKTLKTKGVLK